MSAAAAPKAKKAKAPATHPKYSEMVVTAIQTLKERGGSSRQAVVKYIQANYTVGDNVGSQVKLALRKMVAGKQLNQTKGTGASGSFKVGTLPKDKKPAAKKPKAKKPAAKKPKAKKPAAKKAAAKKATKSPKKAAKKPAAKKPAAKKAAKSPKKAAKKPAKKVAKKPAAKAKKPAKK